MQSFLKNTKSRAFPSRLMRDPASEAVLALGGSGSDPVPC
jgi:hypothetical protein